MTQTLELLLATLAPWWRLRGRAAQSFSSSAMKLRAGGRVLELDDPTSSSMAPIFSDTWLGTELWPAARALVAFLEERRTALATAAQVLELGA